MIISNITPAQVWTNSARSLTNFGSSALTPTNVVNASLAGAASIDLRTSAGIVELMSIAAQTGAAATGSISIQLFDGTVSRALATSAAGANAIVGFSTANNNGVGARLQNNDATNAAAYLVSGISFTI